MKYFQRQNTRLKLGRFRMKFMRGRQDLFIFLSIYNTLIITLLKFENVRLSWQIWLAGIVGLVVLVWLWIKFDEYIHGCEIDYTQGKSSIFKEMQEQLNRIEDRLHEKNSVFYSDKDKMFDDAIKYEPHLVVDTDWEKK